VDEVLNAMGERENRLVRMDGLEEDGELIAADARDKV
jgi:hypothetical protein